MRARGFVPEPSNPLHRARVTSFSYDQGEQDGAGRSVAMPNEGSVVSGPLSLSSDYDSLVCRVPITGPITMGS